MFYSTILKTLFIKDNKKIIDTISYLVLLSIKNNFIALNDKPIYFFYMFKKIILF